MLRTQFFNYYKVFSELMPYFVVLVINVSRDLRMSYRHKKESDDELHESIPPFEPEREGHCWGIDHFGKAMCWAKGWAGSWGGNIFGSEKNSEREKNTKNLFCIKSKYVWTKDMQPKICAWSYFEQIIIDE